MSFFDPMQAERAQEKKKQTMMLKYKTDHDVEIVNAFPFYAIA